MTSNVQSIEFVPSEAVSVISVVPIAIIVPATGDCVIEATVQLSVAVAIVV